LTRSGKGYPACRLSPTSQRLQQTIGLPLSGCLCWSFCPHCPVVFPFVFIGEAKLALRISNGIAIAMLFLCGYALGRHSGQHPWVLGSAMVVVGVALTGVAILLGG
jgi:hypothetical protein